MLHALAFGTAERLTACVGDPHGKDIRSVRGEISATGLRAIDGRTIDGRTYDGRTYDGRAVASRFVAIRIVDKRTGAIQAKAATGPRCIESGCREYWSGAAHGAEKVPERCIEE